MLKGSASLGFKTFQGCVHFHPPTCDSDVPTWTEPAGWRSDHSTSSPPRRFEDLRDATGCVTGCVSELFKFPDWQENLSTKRGEQITVFRFSGTLGGFKPTDKHPSLASLGIIISNTVEDLKHYIVDTFWNYQPETIFWPMPISSTGHLGEPHFRRQSNCFTRIFWLSPSFQILGFLGPISCSSNNWIHYWVVTCCCKML